MNTKIMLKGMRSEIYDQSKKLGEMLLALDSSMRSAICGNCKSDNVEAFIAMSPSGLEELMTLAKDYLKLFKSEKIDPKEIYTCAF